MGKIGPRQQRFEVLPAVSWGLDDLLDAWRADAPQESGLYESGAAADDRRDLLVPEPDHR